MKKKWIPVWITILTTLCMLCTSLPALAVDYTQVAEEGERAAVEEVGVEGMTPISAKDVDAGVYDVTVQSSSSMFRIDKAKLTVKDGKMTADVTLSGTGYLKLFMGTAQQAAKSEESAYIGYTEGDDGKYTYTLPVDALDQPIDCASFSKRREKWYDHAILFEAKSLPKDAVKVELPDYDALEKAAQEKRVAAMEASSGEAVSEAASSETEGQALADGVYQTEVTLEGGSGKATIASPTELRVKDGKATAIIEWSSPNYDYMIVDGQKYQPVNSNGNSKFEIPVASPNGTMEVIADTTAMSTPHEITYKLTFRTDDKRVDTWLIPAVIGIVVSCAIVLFAVYRLVARKKR